jgi:cobalt-precorrin 5A hydrolase
VKLALISLCDDGAAVAHALAACLGPVDLYFHTGVARRFAGRRFAHVTAVTRRIFAAYRGLIFVTPCGVAVRAVAPCLRHKRTDPAVVVVDVGGRFAVSLLSGHEGGANDLAVRVANAIDAEPVISTTTEAQKTAIVGVGCRRGTPAAAIVKAIRQALVRAKVELGDVRLLASADLKADEAGLIEAARRLGLPLRLIAGREICACRKNFTRSKLVQARVGLPAVAEPAALLAGRRTQLILPRQTFQGITVAVARENCWWWASAPAAPPTAPAAPNKPSRKRT